METKFLSQNLHPILRVTLSDSIFPPGNPADDDDDCSTSILVHLPASLFFDPFSWSRFNSSSSSSSSSIQHFGSIELENPVTLETSSFSTSILFKLSPPSLNSIDIPLHTRFLPARPIDFRYGPFNPYDSFHLLANQLIPFWNDWFDWFVCFSYSFHDFFLDTKTKKTQINRKIAKYARNTNLRRHVANRSVQIVIQSPLVLFHCRNSRLIDSVDWSLIENIQMLFPSTSSSSPPSSPLNLSLFPNIYLYSPPPPSSTTPPPSLLRLHLPQPNSSYTPYIQFITLICIGFSFLYILIGLHRNLSRLFRGIPKKASFKLD